MLLNRIKEHYFLFKIHHWIKNLIIFFPVIASNSFEHILIKEAIFFFFYFSFMSSIVYLFNNLYDYKKDIKNKKLNYRINTTKIINYYYLFFILFSIQTLSLFFIDIKIYLITVLYLIISVLYTLIIKKLKYLDIIALVFFHSLRIIYGSYVFEIDIKSYFIIFCLSIFLMIGSNKRLVELNLNFIGRPYKIRDTKILNFIQIFSGFIAIFTFSNYSLDSSHNILFSNTYLNFFNLVVMILLIFNFIFLKKNIHQDIVEFIYKNKINFILILLFFISYFLDLFFL